MIYSYLLSVCFFVQVLLAAPRHLQKRLDNGLALTPPMGWNSYNYYACLPNQSIIESNAKAVVDLGLADLGYDYVTCDCGWTLPDRAPDGTLPWNASLFPAGFPAMGSYIHSLGLKFGVYSDGGIQMCMNGLPNQTGSLGHETIDANTFASWGADLLKYDNCYSSASHDYPDADYTPTVSPKGRYATMSAALNATGRDMLYQICDWGVDFPSAWAPALGDTWRITNDIIPEWRTIYRQVNQIVPQTSFAGPGQWLDMDMLEVGNNIFTTPEEQTHFSLWAILKSPLVIGCALNDTLTSIAPVSLAILKNKLVIALNQDTLGIPANLTRRYTDQQYDIWSGPLSSDRIVVALVNWANTTRSLTLSLASDLNLASITSLHNIWSNTTHTSITGTYTSSIPAHGTLLLILSSPLPLPPTWRGPSTYHPAPTFALSGTANLTTCPPSLCLPSHSKISALSPNGTATLTIPSTPGPAKRYVEITYINNDIAFTSSWTNGTNSRNVTIAVNGKERVRLDVPLSGRRSELFGLEEGLGGWGDSAVLGVDVEGWKVDGDGTMEDVVLVGNAGGDEEGVVQREGAEVVGLRVFTGAQ